MTVRRCLVWLLAWLVVGGHQVHAQSIDERPSLSKVVAVNIILGAFTAGLAETLRGKNPLDASLRGAVGGGIIIGGKCIIGEGRSITDWLGRGTVSIGSSVVANAAEGRALFGRLSLSVGPISVHRDDSARRPLIKLNLATSLTAAYLIAHPDRNLLGRESLRHGVLVFEGESGQGNHEAAGTMILTRGVRRLGITHEMVHVAQGEFVTTSWGRPVERWLVSTSPSLTRIYKYVDFGILYIGWAGLNRIIEHNDRPWEREATRIAQSCWEL